MVDEADTSPKGVHSAAGPDMVLAESHLAPDWLAPDWHGPDLVIAESHRFAAVYLTTRAIRGESTPSLSMTSCILGLVGGKSKETRVLLQP